MHPLALAESARCVYGSITHPGMEQDVTLTGWVAVAKAAPDAFEAMEGMPLLKVAERLYTIWYPTFTTTGPSWATLPELSQVAWEAVARHLMALLDDFDGEEMSLEELEQSWGPWASSKLEKLQASTKG